MIGLPYSLTIFLVIALRERFLGIIKDEFLTKILVYLSVRPYDNLYARDNKKLELLFLLCIIIITLQIMSENLIVY